MFLYWKKRGEYELEALPPALAQVGMERYSWSSSLDVIRDLCGKLGYWGGHLTKRTQRPGMKTASHERGERGRTDETGSTDEIFTREEPASWKSGCFLVRLRTVPAEADSFGIGRKEECHARNNDKPVQEEDWVVCQHPECPERRRASKLWRNRTRQDELKGVGRLGNGPLPAQTAGGSGIMWRVSGFDRDGKDERSFSQLALTFITPPLSLSLSLSL
ncbi:hypothetical protein EYF80_043949 [Liparis tanakae]|uniref:Uncharacterized protein n=1 Tax=Liparis tanakae TaxID=230148 RepID=A0A4Z2FY00_9TELE|nr:hypothetical protein EYF80_043949 [Liparis tanakae]